MAFLHTPSWNDISVHSAKRGPVSHDSPMAQQTHCHLPESRQARSHSKHHTSTPTVFPMAHLTHSDSCLLGGGFLSDRDDHWVLFDSPCPSCSGWWCSGAFLSPGPDSALLSSETQDWPPQVLEGGEGYKSPPYSTSMYHCMMSYITSVYEDAMGWRIDLEHPAAPGSNASPA
ncbi:uncharacterized protein LOC123518236 [Portunus trituberculatus]|uniref:uncharacterized protein LOC123518236 n=1 Tax=Portunus trituberculatus TaxID=210409 RepID=UPI001E1D1195|nr:uncharacterized protein LOC123518236 [Portunus trituberculatus]